MDNDKQTDELMNVFQAAQNILKGITTLFASPFALVGHLLLRPGPYGERSIMSLMTWIAALWVQWFFYLLSEPFIKLGGDAFWPFALLQGVTFALGAYYLLLHSYRYRRGREVYSHLYGRINPLFRPLLRIPLATLWDIHRYVEPLVLVALGFAALPFSGITGAYLLCVAFGLFVRWQIVFSIQRGIELDRLDTQTIGDVQAAEQSEEETPVEFVAGDD